MSMGMPSEDEMEEIYRASITPLGKLHTALTSMGVYPTLETQGDTQRLYLDSTTDKVIGENDMKFVFDLKGNFIEIDLSA